MRSQIELKRIFELINYFGNIDLPNFGKIDDSRENMRLLKDQSNLQILKSVHILGIA